MRVSRRFFAFFFLILFALPAFPEIGRDFLSIEKKFGSVQSEISESQVVNSVCALFKNEIEKIEEHEKNPPLISLFNPKNARKSLRNALSLHHRNGLSPIFYAAVSGDAVLVRKMLDFGSEADEQCRIDFLGKKMEATPLQFLSNFYARRNFSAAKALVEGGADVDSVFFADGERKTPLFCAAFSFDFEFFEFLLSRAKTEKIDSKISARVENIPSGEPPKRFRGILSGSLLCHVCAKMSGDDAESLWKVAKSLVARGADLEARAAFGSNGATPLFFLCMNAIRDGGKIGRISEFLEFGADPNGFCTVSGWTGSPFHFAAKNSPLFSEGVFQLFLDFSGDSSKRDGEGLSAFEYMEKNQKNAADRIEFSYAQTGRADFSSVSPEKWREKTTSGGKSLLFLAVENGDEENALKILEGGAVDWREADGAGRNSFDIAAARRLSRVLEWFSESGEKIGSSVFSLLDSAVETGDVSFLERFLSREDFSRVSARVGKSVFPPFVYACMVNSRGGDFSRRRKVLETLLKFGFSVDERTRSGESALLLAAKVGNSQLSGFLIENGADLSVRDSEGKNALFYALSGKSEEIFLQIASNPDFLAQDEFFSDGTTLLMALSRFGTFSEARLLLPKIVSKSPDSLEKADREGLTAFLHAAASNADFRVLSLLRMYGADVNAVDKKGRNARDLAVSAKNSEAVVRRLESWGVY